jgi:hypothetical protein
MIYADYQASDQERELVERAFGLADNPADAPEKTSRSDM